MGALDLALWDLKGKALDVPLYELLSGQVRNDGRRLADRVRFTLKPMRADC